MKLFKIFLSSTLIVFSFLFSNFVFAEEVNTLDTKEVDKTVTNSKIELLSTVNIKNVKILSSKENDFILSFDITNREISQDNVKYGVKLIGNNDKGQFVADEQVYSEILKLEENTSIHKEIKYTAPSNLGGKYNIYITAKNTSGFPFGSMQGGEISITPSTTGINIMPDSCFVSVENEIPNKKYSLSEGVDVNVLENIILNCEVINSSTKEISAKPIYETKYRSAYGDVVEAEGGTIDPISLKPSESKNISIILPKAKAPQSYNVRFSLSNGSTSSNSIFVHYVVSGDSGTLQNVSLNRNSYKKGDTAIISFLSSSRADVFPGNRSGIDFPPSNNIEIEILNNKGDQCINKIKQEAINGKTELSVPIILNCKNPTINIVLKDNFDNILDKKSVSYERESNIKDMITSPISIGVMIIIILLIIFLFIKRKKNNVTEYSKKIISIFFFLLVASFISPNIAKANVYTLGDQNGIHAYFVVNGIDTYYGLNESINLTGEITVSSCNNTTPLAEASVTYNGETKYLFKDTTEGGKTKQFTEVSFNASSEINESDSMILTLKFNGQEKQEIIKFRVGGDRYRAVCATDSKINTPYECKYGYVKEESKSENNNSWSWKCSSYDNAISSDTCKMNKTPVDGACNLDYNRPGWQPRCISGNAIDLVNNTWKCEGLYGGKTSGICNSGPVNTYCGKDPYTCINGGEELYPSERTLRDYGNQVSWICYHKITENSSSGEWCYGSLDTTKGDTWAKIDASCDIALEDSNCDLNISWEYVNKNQDYKICHTDKSTNVTKCETKSGQKGSGIFGQKKYDQSTVVSLRDMSDNVLAQDEVLSNCKYGAFIRWNGQKCVRDGGWSLSYPASSCIASCEGKTAGTIVDGVLYKDRVCNNPAPSTSGDNCKGDSTLKESCKFTCTGNNPLNPTISGPITFGVGEPQTFSFKGTDPEGSLVRYGIDWDFKIMDPFYDFYYYNEHKDSDELYIKDSIKITDWLPLSTNNGNSFHFVTSGTPQSSSYTWYNPGVYTFRAITQDYDGNISNYWTPKTVTVYNNAWVSFTANPYTIKNGDSSILTWKSGYTDNCKIKNKDTGDILNNDEVCLDKTSWYKSSSCNNGSITVKPEVTTDYSIICEPNTDSEKKLSITKDVTVEVRDITAEDIISVTLTPASQVINEGNPVTLIWSSENTTYCKLVDDQGSEININKSKADKKIEYPTKDTTYTLTCGNGYDNKNSSKQSVITVKPACKGDGCGTGTDDGKGKNNTNNIIFKEI